MLLRYQTLSSSKSSVYCIFLICYGLFKNRLEQILIGVAITQDAGTLKGCLNGRIEIRTL